MLGECKKNIYCEGTCSLARMGDDGTITRLQRDVADANEWKRHYNVKLQEARTALENHIERHPQPNNTEKKEREQLERNVNSYEKQVSTWNKEVDRLMQNLHEKERAMPPPIPLQPDKRENPLTNMYVNHVSPKHNPVQPDHVRDHTQQRSHEWLQSLGTDLGNSLHSIFGALFSSCYGDRCSHRGSYVGQYR